MADRLNPKVSLRDPVDSDAEVHFSYPPEAEIVRMYGGDAREMPTAEPARSERWLKWFRNHPFAQIITYEGEPVGYVRLHSLIEADRRATLSIGMFSLIHAGKGIGRAAIERTLDHAFGPMGLHRVDLRVLDFNKRAIRCYLACGFVHEGTERETAWLDGVWHDDWMMSILEHEHRAKTKLSG